MRRVGFVVNPIAGMGGRVGLKGTDGKVKEARARGAEPRAPGRARDALASLVTHAADADETIELLAAGGEMGASIVHDVDFECEVVTDPPTETGAADTREAVRRFAEHVPPAAERNGRAAEPRDEGVDLVLFVGGDGTAVDVAETLEERSSEIPILGVPAGVKIYSSVFAVSPRAAGRIAATFDDTESREVNDIDEDAYREGEVHTELRALAQVPVAEEIQSSKQLGGGTVATLAAGVASEIEPGTTYVLGPGSTVGAIADELGFEGTPLGVDVWRADPAGPDAGEWPAGEVLARDASADEILACLGDRNVVVVSPIGGQGFVFGRGNQQLSPDVLRQSDVEIVASRRKLDDIGVLRVDTGDTDLDDELRGWRKVRIGRVERRLMKVV
ncbi:MULTISPECIES: ATP-NAD kinase family protein [Halococcus]|uniref:ATP-NAD/AcoX kinase n=1 Tax=Halococcus salifodinae DSM 8989 TaxID=1227456 RepID=M0NFU8_9EURY|nr:MULTISPECIES: ATP-NAD kinase family protein [Halococcus]EMA55969.1 ATP-NAD/AcoX kinase [Halococcus salifodinae DSM 8989]